ncbi:MAG: LysR family transcriptional regulator [Gammaproteobacteria bacterium]|nr:LysR family transcriptional regulator [Gammaproteobacteria bacterium]TVS11610.1 MAG: LysR family transcriptional regulator [Gammaproteobacteria bacterium]
MNVFRMTKLRHFCAVAEHGSIGLAARLLNISQPALTRSLQRLESEFDKPLFERTAQGVTLTPLGQTLLPHAKTILVEVDRASENLQSLKDQQRVRIRLGLSPNFVRHVIPDVIEAFITRYPHASVEVQSGTGEQLLALLGSGALDIAVTLVWRGTLDASLGRVMNIHQIRVGETTAGVYAPSDHPLAGQRSSSLEELATQRWAVPYSLSISYVFQNVFTSRSLAPPLQTINSSHLSMIVPLCTRLQLVTIMPRHVVAEDVAAGRMAPVSCPPLELKYGISLLLRRRSSAMSALNELTEMLKSHFRRGDA